MPEINTLKTPGFLQGKEGADNETRLRDLAVDQIKKMILEQHAKDQPPLSDEVALQMANDIFDSQKEANTEEVRGRQEKYIT